MILITSGAYLESEFSDEIGLLPPSFLPVGNKRLFEHQQSFLHKLNLENKIYISLPISFIPDKNDNEVLKNLNLKVIKVQEKISLGRSIYESWLKVKKKNQSLTILHGDTLFLKFKFENLDLITAHKNKGQYQRAVLNNFKNGDIISNDWSSDESYVISGFFNFKNSAFFINCLKRVNFEFIRAINLYNQSTQLKISSEGEWLDFGHLNSFYQSRTKFTTERNFNFLNITSNIVTKGSKKIPEKIIAEANWYKKIPINLRVFVPAYLGSKFYKNKQSRYLYYQIEYLHSLSLSEMLVFSRLNSSIWGTVFSQINNLLANFKLFKKKITRNDLKIFNTIYERKTKRRLSEFSKNTSFSLDKKIKISKQKKSYSLNEIVTISSKYIGEIDHQNIAIVHGDFCFSNLFFDRRSQQIKCIDPRGISENSKLSIYGDTRYDYAKLYHSIVGLYDFILANKFKVTKKNFTYDIIFLNDNNIIEKIEKLFMEIVLKKNNISLREILAINVHLFLSMLPLHGDNPKKQEALLVNSLRLFYKLIN